jgi:hypothetical protein
MTSRGGKCSRAGTEESIAKVKIVDVLLVALPAFCLASLMLAMERRGKKLSRLLWHLRYLDQWATCGVGRPGGARLWRPSLAERFWCLLWLTASCTIGVGSRSACWAERRLNNLQTAHARVHCDPTCARCAAKGVHQEAEASARNLAAYCAAYLTRAAQMPPMHTTSVEIYPRGDLRITVEAIGDSENEVTRFEARRAVNKERLDTCGNVAALGTADAVNDLTKLDQDLHGARKRLKNKASASARGAN